MMPNRHLKQARELRGWSQAKVAGEIGTDATTVSRWERGLFSPTPYFRERLCTLFDKNAWELGLLENMHQARADEQTAPQQPSSLPDNKEWQREDCPVENALALLPPSWSERTDTFSYILLSAAHDQQAHRLWQDAYVRALHGQSAEARKLGEASLRAFERIGHVNAVAVREWLNQPACTSPSSLPNVSSTGLLAPSEQPESLPKRFLRESRIRIAFILISSFWLLFALDVPLAR